MKFKTRKDILIIISYIAVIIFALVNFDKIINVLKYVINILSPFIIGALLAFILNVLVKFIETKVFGKIKQNKTWRKIKRPLSITISLILVGLIIYFVMNLLIPQLRNSVSLFTDTLPGYKEDVIDILEKFDVGQNTIDKVGEYLDNFTKVITDYIKDNSKDVLSITTEVATSIISIISKGIISLVFAIYIIAQKETLKRQTNKLMKAYLKPRVSNKISDIATMANKTFSNFVTGQCLEAIIFGSLCFVGMLIFRLPYASTISVVMGFTALIPVFGSIIGTALGAFLILMISPIKAIIFVAFIIILQQLEGNLIYPKVVGKSIGLPGMWVLFSVTIGASVAGIWGMFIATPLFSVLYSIFSKIVNDKINKNKVAIKIEEKKA